MVLDSKWAWTTYYKMRVNNSEQVLSLITAPHLPTVTAYCTNQADNFTISKENNWTKKVARATWLSESWIPLTHHRTSSLYNPHPYHNPQTLNKFYSICTRAFILTDRFYLISLQPIYKPPLSVFLFKNLSLILGKCVKPPISAAGIRIFLFLPIKSGDPYLA